METVMLARKAAHPMPASSAAKRKASREQAARKTNAVHTKGTKKEATKETEQASQQATKGSPSALPGDDSSSVAWRVAVGLFSMLSLVHAVESMCAMFVLAWADGL